MKKKLCSMILVCVLVLCALPLSAFAGAGGGITLYYYDAETLERIDGLFSEYSYTKMTEWPFAVEQPDGTTLPVFCFYPVLRNSQFHIGAEEISQVGTHKLSSYPVPAGYETVKVFELRRTEQWAMDPTAITAENIGADDFTITEGFFDDLIFSVDYEVDTSAREKNIGILLQKANVTPVTPIAEVPSSWAAEQVNAAIVANLVPAALQSKYTQATTRAEFCALAVTLYEMLEGEIVNNASFTDTSDINVEKAATIGVVTGVGEGKFAPDDKLTREQAATMLSRLANAIGKPLAEQTATFGDNGSVSSWATDAVGQMQATGIMTGVGNNTFAPKSDYTREQSIATFIRLWDIAK